MNTIFLSIYEHLTECRVLRIYDFGTVDVERLSDGRCFRVSGLRIEKKV